MIYFNLFFALGMILLPVVIAGIFYRSAPEISESLRQRLLTSLLWTGAALTIFLALFVWRVYVTPKEPGRAQSYPLDQLMCFAFLPLWFFTAMPVIRLARPDLANPADVQGSLRVASLVSRRRPAALRPWMVVVPLLFFVAALVYCLMNGLASSDMSSQRRGLAIVLLLCGSFGLMAGPIIQRATMEEPEPMAPQPSEELASAYASHRNAKIAGLFTLVAAMQILALAGACGICTYESLSLKAHQTLGLVGGIGGSLIGVAGGAFGCWMSIKRMRIHKLRSQLTSADS